MSDVLFKECTNSEYSSLTPDSNTFYKVQDSSSDDPDVYLGATELSKTTNVSVDGNILYLNSTPFELFDSYSCAAVANIVQSGQAENYWSIGDTTNLITLNGALGDYLTFEDYKCKAILIDFDHNKDLETDGKHSITLQFGQSEDGINIDFVDSRYSSYDDNYNCLCMNLSQTNSGGWESSHMRNDICPQFLELLPGDLQSVIGTITKYTDNASGTSSIESNITATKDKIFLLSYYEVGYTSSEYVNRYEANYIEPYSEIYKSNDDRVHKRHTSTAGSTWWTRSRSRDTSFWRVGSAGTEYDTRADTSYGFSPAIVIY